MSYIFGLSRVGACVPKDPYTRLTGSMYESDPHCYLQYNVTECTFLKPLDYSTSNVLTSGLKTRYSKVYEPI